MEVNPAAELLKRAAVHRATMANVQGILGGTYTPPSAAFSKLAKPAREYQQQAASIILANGSLLIADDLGTGKTVCAITALTDPRTLPALVVTLTHLPPQWEDALYEFAPNLTVHTLTSGRPYDIEEAHRKEARRRKKRYNGGMPDVLITSYHKLGGWSDALGGKMRFVIFDEVQELRRSASIKFAAAGHISRMADFRCGLSATPIYNYGGEIFNVLDTLKPGALGSRSEFIREWCGGNVRGDEDKAKIADPKAFGAYARESGLMIRRTRRDCGRELGDLQKINHLVDGDPSALDSVDGAAAELARFILAGAETYKGQRMQASAEFDRIVRQQTGVAKAPAVANFVRMIIESEEKPVPVLLYGWHRSVYDIWREKLADFKPAFYTGTESTTQKVESLRRFKAGETPLLIMSLRAGAGVDGLQHMCSVTVAGELDWSPQVHDQNVGRVYRDGQKDPVLAYFLISEFGSDPTIVDTLGIKRQQSGPMLDPNAPLLAAQRNDDAIAKLARAYLAQTGRSLPPETLFDRTP